tara:strand:- start:10679 stop:11437 length:759 start_codon:yes stop_codon:yes gene_type:complete
MEILIGKKQTHPFVFVKARRCGSNSLNVWLRENVGRENYLDLSGDNQFINYDLFDIVENDILASPKVTFCRNPYTRVVAGYLADIWHYAPSFPVNVSDLDHPNQPPADADFQTQIDMTQYKMTDNMDLHKQAFTYFLDEMIDYLGGNDAKHWWQVTLVNEPLFHTVLDNDPYNIDFFDHVVKQEEIGNVWPDISKQVIGHETAFYLANNFRGRHPNDKRLTTDFLPLLEVNNNKEKIAEYWKMDFECFGYEK